MLCTDYKITAKIITNRPKLLFKKAIEEEQRVGLKRRQLTDNLNSIRTAIIGTENSKKNKISANNKGKGRKEETKEIREGKRQR